MNSTHRKFTPSGRRLILATALATLGAPTAANAWWQPQPGLSWHIQYTGSLNTALKVAAYDIDLFDTSTATIAALHGQSRKVICYFSAGSYEDWRPDVARFPAAALGKPLSGWPGERWLDVRNPAVRAIMEARMDLAVSKGCDAIDPDNVDGYTNSSGFPLSYADQLQYNLALADAAHDRGLAIALKNDLEQIPDLVQSFDFAVNEQCFQYRECDALSPFVAASKAVLGIEYKLARSKFCPQANSLRFSFQRKRLDLNAWSEPC